MPETRRKPDWLKVKAPLGETYSEIKKLLGDLHLHSVCEEANCPNRYECWSNKTATFMILGDRCTRSCKFCNVTSGDPRNPDENEPRQVAQAVSKMGLKYAVITSVTRDDLPDGGASVFAETISAVRQANPGIGIEVLIPDFGGDPESLATVLDASPDVLNHNVETTRRLTPVVRSGADYDRSLELLRRVAESGRDIRTKSGLMVGLGETLGELKQTFEDLAGVSCQLLTIGQYLAPSDEHYPVERYYRPVEFEELKEIALGCGFDSVLSGPLVRSSYHAREQSWPG